MSKNKLTLIIPDIHHRVKQADKIIKSVGADEIIFLGDFMDDFNDTPEMVEGTCDWLNHSIKQPNRIHMFGNHDVHYAFSNRILQCSGYEQWKYFIIHDLVSHEVWDKFKWYHFLDDKWMLSHAGLHKLNVPGSVTGFSSDRKVFINLISKFLDNSIKDAFQDSTLGPKSWVLNAGRCRGGYQRVGGITWCDFTREFFPLQGINQIMGHTPQMQGATWCLLNDKEKVEYHRHDLYSPTLKELNDTSLSTNICLDVHGNTHWATWDGKKMEIGNYKSL